MPALTVSIKEDLRLYRDKTNNKQGAVFTGPGGLLVINDSLLVLMQPIGSVPCMVPLACLKDATRRRQRKHPNRWIVPPVCISVLSSFKEM